MTPEWSQEVVFLTGDCGVYEKGQLCFLGRLDRQCQVLGQRVELGELESHLREYPGMMEVSVQMIGDGDQGTGTLSAFLVLEEGGSSRPERHSEFSL